MTKLNETTALLSETEAASYLGVSRRTLYNWRKRKISPIYFIMGKRLIRYQVCDLEKWILAKKWGISYE